MNFDDVSYPSKMHFHISLKSCLFMATLTLFNVKELFCKCENIMPILQNSLYLFWFSFSILPFGLFRISYSSSEIRQDFVRSVFFRFLPIHKNLTQNMLLIIFFFRISVTFFWLKYLRNKFTNQTFVLMLFSVLWLFPQRVSINFNEFASGFVEHRP